jgi:hypothetical protein
VVVCVEPEATRKPVYGALQVTVVKRHQAPAGLAQQVVMMSAGRVDYLIAGHAATQIQARDEPPLLEKVKDPIDARASHATFPGAEPIFDVQGTKRAGLAREEVNHRVARATFAMSCLIEHRTGVLSPLRTTDHWHANILAAEADSGTPSCFRDHRSARHDENASPIVHKQTNTPCAPRGAVTAALEAEQAPRGRHGAAEMDGWRPSRRLQPGARSPVDPRVNQVSQTQTQTVPRPL